MAHINLMTSQARIRECSRQQLRRWNQAILALVIVLGGATAVHYYPCYAAAKERETLEVRAQSIHQLQAANERLEERITQIQEEEQFVLGLSRKTPVVSLIGLIGSAVAENEGKVFLEQIEYSSDSIPGRAVTSRSGDFELTGIGTDGIAVKKFAEALQKQLPHASVQLNKTGEQVVNKQAVQRFTVMCTF